MSPVGTLEEDADCSSPPEDDEELPDEDAPDEDALSEEEAEEDWEEELLGAASTGAESDVRSITSVMKSAVLFIA